MLVVHVVLQREPMVRLSWPVAVFTLPTGSWGETSNGSQFKYFADFSDYKMFPPNLVLARAKGCDILKLKVTHGCRYIPVANRMAFVIVDTAPMFLD